jgi:hypothetical protein
MVFEPDVWRFLAIAVYQVEYCFSEEGIQAYDAFVRNGKFYRRRLDRRGFLDKCGDEISPRRNHSIESRG